jgi:hypothetical protein
MPSTHFFQFSSTILDNSWHQNIPINFEKRGGHRQWRIQALAERAVRPSPIGAAKRTIFQKVKAKKWLLAGGEVAMQSVTVMKEKRLLTVNNFGETTAARSELLPRHALHPVYSLAIRADKQCQQHRFQSTFIRPHMSG